MVDDPERPAEKKQRLSKSYFLRSLHAHERTKLRLRLSARCAHRVDPATFFADMLGRAPRNENGTKQRRWALRIAGNPRDFSACVRLLFIRIAGKDLVAQHHRLALASSVRLHDVAALLGARKRVPTWRVGRAQAWMRGHLWLGFLALPMIFFTEDFIRRHAHARPDWLLIITVFSGVFGAALQHISAHDDFRRPAQTIYDESAAFARSFAKKPIARSNLSVVP